MMEEETMNPVVHFEMPYENRERMAKFYGSAFGWQTQMLGEGNRVSMLQPLPGNWHAPKSEARS